MQKIRLILLLLVMLSIVNVLVFAENLEFNPMDVILLLDVSKSMNQSDPERLAFEAMNLLVDLVENEQAKVKIITFAGKIHEETPFYSLDSLDQKNVVKDQLTKIITNKSATDIGNALEYAVKAFKEEADKDTQKLIIMLSDGKTEVGDATNKSFERLNVALQEASNNDIYIHTIGLNKHKKVNINELENISEATMAQSFIIDDQSQLPGAITKIYAQHSGNASREISKIIADGTLQTAKFLIPDSGVLSAHIIMTSSKAINQIELLDQNDEVIPFDEIKYKLTQTNFYSFIKITNPEDSSYSVRFMGQKLDQIFINLMTTEQLKLLTTLQEIEDENDVKLLRLEAKLMNNSGENLSNHPGLTTLFIIKNNESELEYTAVLKEDIFTVDIPIDFSNKITIYAVTASKRFHLESEPIDYIPHNAAVNLVENIIDSKLIEYPLGMILLVAALLLAGLFIYMRKRKYPIFDASAQVYLRIDCDAHVPPRTINFLRDNPFGLSKFKLEPFVSDSMIRADMASLLSKMRYKLQKIVIKPARNGRLRVFIPKDIKLNNTLVTKSRWIEMVEKPQFSVTFVDDPNENVVLNIEFV